MLSFNFNRVVNLKRVGSSPRYYSGWKFKSQKKLDEFLKNYT